jgi:hypothetical protein
MMVNGLSRNASVSHIRIVVSLPDEALFDALVTALPSNSTLQRLDLGWGEDSDDGPDLAPLFLALETNKGLKSLSVSVGSMDESLSTAMKDGLGTNETLERLVLHVPLCDDSSVLWCRAFSFFRFNKALKSLIVDLDYDVVEPCLVTAFCVDIATNLQENASLESLAI